MDAHQYKDMLLAIYPCKVPFTLALKDDKPKRRLGTYYGSSRRIILHTGWLAKYDMMEVAIHEYAHHLHDSEFGGKEKRQAPHGKEFWQIYGQLMCRAKELGLCDDGKSPVLVFPDRSVTLCHTMQLLRRTPRSRLTRLSSRTSERSSRTSSRASICG